MTDPQLKTDVKKGAGSFTGNVLALGTGAATVQALALLTSPIISRLFEPEAFGIAAIYVSVIAIIGPIGCFRYELAIMLPKRDEDAANLFVLCVIITLAITTLAALIVGFGGQTVLGLLNATALSPYRWVILLGIFMACINLPLIAWNQRHKHFERIASVRFVCSLIGVSAVLITGTLGWKAGINLILARMTAAISTLLILAFFWWRYDVGFVLGKLDINVMWQMVKRYKKFPLFSSWTGFVGNAAIHAPVLLLAGFFGPHVAGLYAISKRVLHLPTRLISTSVGSVFFQRAAATHAASGDISYIVENICRKLIIVGLLPLMIVAIIAPDVFGVIFGQRWAPAGLYASILAPNLFVGFVFSPLATLFFVLERQGLDLLTRIITAALTIGALVFGGVILRNTTITLVLFSVVSSLGILWRLSYLLKTANVRGFSILGHFLLFLIFAAPTVAAYGTCKWLLDLPLVYCLLALVVSAIPYVVLALRRDEQLRMILLKVGKKIRR